MILIFLLIIIIIIYISYYISGGVDVSYILDTYNKKIPISKIKTDFPIEYNNKRYILRIYKTKANKYKYIDKYNITLNLISEFRKENHNIGCARIRHIDKIYIDKLYGDFMPVLNYLLFWNKGHTYIKSPIVLDLKLKSKKKKEYFIYEN